MTNVKTIGAALRTIGDTYATFNGLLDSRTTKTANREPRRRIEIWAELLDSTNPLQVEYVIETIEQMADMTIRPVPPGETLDFCPFHIKELATTKRVKAELRHEQNRKYHEPARQHRANKVKRVVELLTPDGKREVIE